ncbi:hypothetical protein ZIOFF_045544 [Zingiber officinale]|uniref:DUF4283 domain-containing protein n=1 Tax=Zingiber officinale TaxID=94328 RepID=A0A8J5FZD1_ZINOF|nr:hypothetical protein ZIOFF_045544 [Zingiber officinale]
MRIFKWSPKFPYEAESSVIPVWIQLPDLPIHMFCKKGLFAAANIVGRPLKVDQATEDDSRLTMARVCVEIDLLKPKIEDFSIGHSVEECYGNGYHPNPARGVGKQSSAIVGEDPRDLKEDKHLEGIPKECVEAHPGDSEVVSLKAGAGKPAWIPKEKICFSSRDREEELIVNQKMVHEEVGVHVSYGTKPYRGEGVAVAEISKNTRSDASSEEEDVGGSSVLNDESSGGAVRQRPDWDPGILKMMNNIKLKGLDHLKWWNEVVFGNIHDKVKLEEERYAAVEKKFGADPSVVNRIQMGESQASLFKTLHMEEMFWKQKAATKWMGEGDRNTKLFHNLVQKRRLSKWFGIYMRMGSGPDGFSVAFYECWETIKEDVLEAVLDFFNGGTFPRGLMRLSGFFHSKRGLRQGDPISPLLFITSAEFLSRGLDQLFNSSRQLYFATGCEYRISHLAYADDIMILLNCSLIMSNVSRSSWISI